VLGASALTRCGNLLNTYVSIQKADFQPGTVHIESADPTKHPRIDPGYFRNAADAKIMAQGIEWMDKIANHPKLKKSLGKRILPPHDASIETEGERIEYVRNHISVGRVSRFRCVA
jgi:hypothetical protein